MMQYIVVNVALKRLIAAEEVLHYIAPQSPSYTMAHFQHLYSTLYPFQCYTGHNFQTHCSCTSMSFLVAPSFHLVTQLNFKLCFSFFRYCLISNHNFPGLMGISSL